MTEKNGLAGLLILGMLLLFCLGGCVAEEKRPPSCLGDLAYSRGREEAQYTVYLSENGEMVPYLVLSGDYEGTGNCLLLRKFLLKDPESYNQNHRYSAYYEGSLVDQLLCGSFLDTLAVEPAAVSVTITEKDSLWGGSKAYTRITRRVFLLSAAELGDPGSKTVPAEGKALEYFDSPQRRIACTEEGATSSWWLRTPDIWYDNVVCGVQADGAIGIGGIGDEDAYKSGVRPAFCLASDWAIYEKDGLYYLETAPGQLP